MAMTPGDDRRRRRGRPTDSSLAPPPWIRPHASTLPGHRRVAARRPARPAAVRAHGRRSAVRARGRRPAARHHDRLRDLGRARRRRPTTRCSCATPSPATPTPPGPPGPAIPTAGLVGRADRPGQAARHRPLVRRVRQRARRLPGHAPARRRRARTGRPLRPGLPGRVDPRHGAHPGRGWPTHLGIDRWLTVIGGSMGGMQVLEWGVMYPDRVAVAGRRSPPARAATAQQIAWWSDRPAGHRPRPEVARRRLLRRRAGRRSPRRAGAGPHAVARSRTAPTTCSPTGSAGRSSSRSTAGSRCGSASRSSATSSTTATSWSAASTPTPTCCSPRRWTCTTSAAAAAASTAALRAHRGARARRWASTPTSCIPPTSSASCVDGVAPQGGDGQLRRDRQPARPRRLPHRARPGRSPRSTDFLDRIEKSTTP